jgi:hypothetical protein
MTLLVILGIVVLGIGCLLADWWPDDHDEMARRRGFKNGGERRTGSRTVTAAEPEPSHADRSGRLAGHRVPNAERDRQRGQEHGKPKLRVHQLRNLARRRVFGDGHSPRRHHRAHLPVLLLDAPEERAVSIWGTVTVRPERPVDLNQASFGYVLLPCPTVTTSPHRWW